MHGPEMYVAPRDVGGKFMRVLVADGSNERVNTFRLKSSTSHEGFQLRVVRTEGSLVTSLAEPRGWDVVLHSLFLGDWKVQPESFAPPLLSAWNLGTLKGVICTSTIEPEARRFVATLRAAGVPCLYVPFNYANPGQHLKLRLPEIKYELPKQAQEGQQNEQAQS